MAKGMAIPVAPNRFGRTEALEGSEQLNKIVDLNLSDLENENPFQQFKGAYHGEPGLDPMIVFAHSTTSLIARIGRSFKMFFERMQAQGRAKLERGYPQITPDSEKQELIGKVVYVDLENSKPQELVKNYKVEAI